MPRFALATRWFATATRSIPTNAFALGEVLRATSYSAPGNMPLHRKWIASWSHFFDVPGRPRPQSSMRISPHFSGQLYDRTLFPPIVRDGAWGLAYRDLMSAAFAGLWSVNSLIDEIRSRQPSLIGSDPLLEDRGYRVAQLRAWLEQNRGELTDADIETLANDPPLSFYILFEAATGPNDPARQGKTLGALGSIIVAEVVFGAMLEGRIPDEAHRAALRESLSRLSSRIYAANRLDFVPEIDNMGDLVPFVADIANLQNADPTFSNSRQFRRPKPKEIAMKTEMFDIVNYDVWGDLVKKWSRDKTLRPTTIAQFKDQLDQGRRHGQFSRDVHRIDFIDAPYKDGKLLIKLPPAEVLDEAEKDLQGSANYPLPLFYADDMKDSSLENDTPAGRLLLPLQACRRIHDQVLRLSRRCSPRMMPRSPQGRLRRQFRRAGAPNPHAGQSDAHGATRVRFPGRSGALPNHIERIRRGTSWPRGAPLPSFRDETARPPSSPEAFSPRCWRDRYPRSPRGNCPA